MGMHSSRRLQLEQATLMLCELMAITCPRSVGLALAGVGPLGVGLRGSNIVTFHNESNFSFDAYRLIHVKSIGAGLGDSKAMLLPGRLP